LSWLGHSLQEVVAPHAEVIALYGMGSFFRGGQYNDIDLVVVLDCERDKFMAKAATIRTELLAIGERMGEQFDVTIFTAFEFASRPLRDMAELVTIFKRPGGKPKYR
jgi:hypothetical protein